jgi:hypothetical protein
VAALLEVHVPVRCVGRLTEQFDTWFRALEVVIPLVGADAHREITRLNLTVFGCAVFACCRFDVELYAHALLIGTIDLKFRVVLTTGLKVAGDRKAGDHIYRSVGRKRRAGG